MAAAVVAIRNARRKQLERSSGETSHFGSSGSFSSSSGSFAKKSFRREKRADSAGSQSGGLWEAIFGKKVEAGARTAEYSQAGILRAEQRSIERVMEIVGCSEQEAREHLVKHGWSVNSCVSSLLRVGDQSAAPAALGSASAGRIMGRAAYMHAQQEEEPPADEQKLQVALVISVVPGLTPEDAAAILREKGWRVQDAIKSALESNPATFDGQECQIPVGVPVDEVESGRFAFPAGGNVWETDSVSDAQSVTSSMSRSGGGTAPVMSRSGSFTYGDSVPVAIAIEP